MTITNLSDDELLEYAKMISSLTDREISTLEAGQDLKSMYHVVRLGLECEQILVEHDLDLERNSEILKSVRRGEWTFEQLDDWATKKEHALELLYAESTLRHSPDEEAIKEILLTCLEMHYGNLDNIVVKNPLIENLLGDLRSLVDKYTTKPLTEDTNHE